MEQWVSPGLVLMTAYTPLYIRGNQTGLVQSREEFILPDDAYPVLENAYVWRERIKRKQGYELLGRLQRTFSSVSIGDSGSSVWTFTLFTTVSPNITETTAQLNPGSIVIVMGGVTFTDKGNGTLTSPTSGNSGTINYQTSVIALTTTVSSGTDATVSFGYFPGLPVMGLRQRDLNSTNNQLTIAFDTVYAYIFSSGAWREFIPGTTWTGNDDEFFWSTNYWVDNSNLKLFWATNFSGTGGDPIRYTNGVTWTNFAPTIDASGNLLTQALCILPFRGRLVVFNTFEGMSQAGSVNYPQRIRWAAIGNPLTATAWRDDERGQGGFLDIPTNESITSVGFVRDNLVIYCSRSTWQLRYTGRSIAPFQIEKVNSELGAEGTFSTVQFDTSLVGIGDKGIVECDSFKSNRIDIKIPDLVFQFNDSTEGMETDSGTERIQAVRDFVNRLAYWTYPYQAGTPYPIIYPNRRLVYNYENDSWAIFTDSLTALGTFIASSGRTWQNTQIPWDQANFPWTNRQISTPDIIGGNQQGFVEYLDSKVSNDVSLFITGITGNTTTPTQITSPNHNLVEDQVIQISGITGTTFQDLNNGIFGISIVDGNNFLLYVYDSSTQDFTTPQLDASQTYNGGGQIAVRDGFYIQSKKFNFLDDGESIQMGYIDILMDSTLSGAISMNVLMNYNETDPVNIKPQNEDPDTSQSNTFFNSIVPTSNPNSDGVSGTKYWQRIYCPTRGNFITIVYTLSYAQLVGIEQQSDVQIDAQILWNRKAGRLTNR